MFTSPAISPPVTDTAEWLYIKGVLGSIALVMVIGLRGLPAIHAVKGFDLRQQSFTSGLQDLLSRLVTLWVLLFVKLLLGCYKVWIIFAPLGSVFSEPLPTPVSLFLRERGGSAPFGIAGRTGRVVRGSAVFGCAVAVELH
tara:strand:+ start:1728 stop:2150 length:423 start_codon:yes stop_codon:yes gene_type:complete